MIYRIDSLEDWQKTVEALRKAQGMSVQKTAELAGMTNPTLYKLLTSENANPTLKTLLKVGQCLGYSLMITQSPTYYEKQ